MKTHVMYTTRVTFCGRSDVGRLLFVEIPEDLGALDDSTPPCRACLRAVARRDATARRSKKVQS